MKRERRRVPFFDNREDIRQGRRVFAAAPASLAGTPALPASVTAFSETLRLPGMALRGITATLGPRPAGH